jgi:hypothetical protein
MLKVTSYAAGRRPRLSKQQFRVLVISRETVVIHTIAC